MFLRETTEPFINWRGNHRRPILLDHVSAYPGKRSVVVLDNASSHKHPLFESRLAAMGACPQVT